MLLRSVLAIGAWALSASALLVVPHPIETLATIASKGMDIDIVCNDCPFPEIAKNGQVTWKKDVETSVSLNFATDNDALYFNGVKVFPDPSAVVNVKAVERRMSDGKTTQPLRMGFSLETMTVMTQDDDDAELLQFRFDPLDIEGFPAPLKAVSLFVVRRPSGELIIGRFDLEEATTPKGHMALNKCHGKPACLKSLLLQRLRVLLRIVRERIKNAKGRLGLGSCRGRKGDRIVYSHNGQPYLKGVPLRGHRWGGTRPGHLPPPPPPPHGHRHLLHHRVSHIVRFIVVPTLLGIVAGLTASILGTLVGRGINYLWCRYRRNSCCRKRTSGNLEQGTESEKVGLMAADELNEELPPYSEETHVELPADKQ